MPFWRENLTTGKAGRQLQVDAAHMLRLTGILQVVRHVYAAIGSRFQGQELLERGRLVRADGLADEVSELCTNLGRSEI